MSTKGVQFAGLTVALVTPFKNGDIDEPALRKLVDWQVENGVDCLSPVGTTGESPTLSHAEHERVIAIVCEHVAGRVKVMAGTGSNSTREAVRLTKYAQSKGADGALIVAPYYNKPMGEGFYQHYKAISEASSLPIVLYNIPGRTAKNMEPEVVARIAELPTVVAIKESTGSMDQASQVKALTNLTLLSGDDSLTLPMMALGGEGVVSVVGNIVPRDVQAMIKAFRAGNLAEAQRWHLKLFPLCRDLLGLATNPIPIKGAMKMLGRDTGEVRLPMTALSPAEETRMRETLKKHGLIS